MITTGILIALLGGLFQGSFAVFLKYRRSWEWENFWLVYSLTALLILPIVWAYMNAPNIGEVLESLTPNMVLLPILLGGLWGIGAILFGLAVERIGMALSFTVVVGLSSAIGAVVPLFLGKSLPNSEILLTLAIGLSIMVAGISISGYSGSLREKTQNLGMVDRRYFYGLILATLSGILSPMNNVGFAYGNGIGNIAVKLGASASSATLLILAIVLFGGFWVNAGYALFLLKKNGTFGKFSLGGIIPFAGAITAGTFWFGGIGLYGMATAYLGDLGTSVGYSIFVGSVIIVSNLWGILTGEWRKFGAALNVQLLGMLVLITGILVISLSLFR